MKTAPLFIGEGSLLLAGLAYSAFTTPQYIKDYAFALAVVVALYFVQERHPLPTWMLATGLITLLLPAAGLTFEFFSLFAYGIGYDKMLHLVSGAVLTLAAYLWLSKHPRRRAMFQTIIIAMLLVLGLDALGEISEFVGSHYLHTSGPSMFSQGDLLPPTLKNDLVVYDTWWDLIFDLFGTVAAAGIIILVPGHLRKRSKRRVMH